MLNFRFTEHFITFFVTVYTCRNETSWTRKIKFLKINAHNIAINMKTNCLQTPSKLILGERLKGWRKGKAAYPGTFVNFIFNIYLDALRVEADFASCKQRQEIRVKRNWNTSIFYLHKTDKRQLSSRIL